MEGKKIYVLFSTWAEGDGYTAHHPYGDEDKETAIETLKHLVDILQMIDIRMFPY